MRTPQTRERINQMQAKSIFSSRTFWVNLRLTNLDNVKDNRADERHARKRERCDGSGSSACYPAIVAIANEDYIKIAERRLQQQVLFGETA